MNSIIHAYPFSQFTYCMGNIKPFKNPNDQPKINGFNAQNQRYIQKLFYIIRCCTLSLCSILFFAGCGKTDDQEDQTLDDVIIQDASLSYNVQMISWYITGASEQDNDHDETPVSYSPDAKDMKKAYKQFHIAEKMIRWYPKITKHPIARSTIAEIQKHLKKLTGYIEKVTNDKDKNQLINAFNKLAQCVATA